VRWLIFSNTFTFTCHTHSTAFLQLHFTSFQTSFSRRRFPPRGAQGPPLPSIPAPQGMQQRADGGGGGGRAAADVARHVIDSWTRVLNPCLEFSGNL